MISASRARILLEHRGRGARDAAVAASMGALTAFGEPGPGLAPLFLLGLVAISFMAVRARSWLGAARLGLAFGTGIFWVIVVSSVDWGLKVPVALTLIGIALYGLPLTLLCHWLYRRWSGLAAFVGMIAAWSLCQDVGDLAGFPTKGEALSAVFFAPVLMGGGRLVGTNILCGIMMAGAAGTGASLARLTSPRVRGEVVRAFQPLLASFAILFALAGAARVTAPAAIGTITVGVPQMNVPSGYFKLRQALPERTDAFEALFAKQVQELAGVDLLALTETYDGAFPLQVPRVRQRFQNYAKLNGQAVLLTSYLVDKNGGGVNAVGAINPAGELVGVHRKVNLAPFGEVELAQGSGFHALPLLPNAKVGLLICQEALLGEGPRALTRDGATLLVTTTSDVSFGSGLLSFAHLAEARLHSIESGRDMIWASAGGPSGAISRWGQLERGAPFRGVAAARMTADLYGDASPFMRSTWLWPPLCGAALLWLMLRRGARVGVSPVARAPIATTRGAAEVSLSVLFVAACSLASPALVELMSGDPARAKQSALELLGYGEPELGPASLARFHADPAHSAEAAMAFYLDAYGDRTLPATTTFAQNPSLQDVARALERDAGFPTREIQLDFAALPRSFALVKSRAGEFGVLASKSSGLVGLFLPSESGLLPLTGERARLVLEPSALLPALDPDLER